MRLLTTIFIFAFFCISEGAAQNSFGLLPSVNLNKPLQKGYTINLKTEGRQQMYLEGANALTYLQTDVSILGVKKFSYNKKVALGYLSRFKAGKYIPRSIQQLIITQKYPNFILGHRLVTDQTFDDLVTLRLRYRVLFLLPLNGQSLDDGELYLKSGAEWLNILEDRNYDVELRWTFVLGWKLSDLNKVEVGMDHRFDSILDGPARRRSWMVVNWYYRL